jgi:hypothetical protein
MGQLNSTSFCLIFEDKTHQQHLKSCIRHTGMRTDRFIVSESGHVALFLILGSDEDF